MKYLKWIAIIAVTVILCILLAETVSKVFGVSTEIAMLIIFSVAFPAINFVYDCILLAKIKKIE